MGKAKYALKKHGKTGRYAGMEGVGAVYGRDHDGLPGGTWI